LFPNLGWFCETETAIISNPADFSYLYEDYTGHKPTSTDIKFGYGALSAGVLKTTTAANGRSFGVQGQGK